MTRAKTEQQTTTLSGREVSYRVTASPKATRARIRIGPGGVEVIVPRSAGPERAAALNAVATRFTLPPEEVDALITAGGDALRQNTLFREFLTGVGQGPRPVPSARVADAIVAAVP